MGAQFLEFSSMVKTVFEHDWNNPRASSKQILRTTKIYLKRGRSKFEHDRKQFPARSKQITSRIEKYIEHAAEVCITQGQNNRAR